MLNDNKKDLCPERSTISEIELRDTISEKEFNYIRQIGWHIAQKTPSEILSTITNWYNQITVEMMEEVGISSKLDYCIFILKEKEKEFYIHKHDVKAEQIKTPYGKMVSFDDMIYETVSKYSDNVNDLVDICKNDSKHLRATSKKRIQDVAFQIDKYKSQWSELVADWDDLLDYFEHYKTPTKNALRKANSSIQRVEPFFNRINKHTSKLKTICKQENLDSTLYIPKEIYHESDILCNTCKLLLEELVKYTPE